MDLTYKKVEGSLIKDEELLQILKVEQSEGDGYSEQAVRSIYKDMKNVIFVCCDGGEIIAHIVINPTSKRRNGSAYIINLVVSPQYRKRGIGKELIYMTGKHLAEIGYSQPMSLQVDKDNLPAIGLYQKVGFGIVEPICEADEDDEQYIMDSTLQNIITTIEKQKKPQEESYAE